MSALPAVVLLALGSVPLLLLAAVAAARTPSLVLGAYAAVVPFGSTVDIPLPPPADNVSSLIGLLAIGAYAMHLLTSEHPALPVRTPTALWTLLLAAASITTLWSIDRSATVGGLIVLVGLLALYALVAATPTRPVDVRRVELGTVAGGTIVGAYAVFLAATGELTDAVDQRFVATWGGSETNAVADPNVTAAALLLPFLLAVAATLRRGPQPRRAAFGTAAAAMFVGIFLTGSRGGLIAVLAGLAVLVLCSGYGKRAFLAVLVPLLGIAVAVAVAPASVTERVSSDSRSSGRSDIWRIGALSCPEYCLQGSGWSTFPEVHERRWLTDPEARGVQRRFEAHSIWLSALVEGGVLAFGLIAAALAMTVRGALRLPRLMRGPPLAGLVSLLISNVFLSTLPFKYFWLGLMYAVMVQNCVSAPADRTVPPPRREVALR